MVISKITQLVHKKSFQAVVLILGLIAPTSSINSMSYAYTVVKPLKNLIVNNKLATAAVCTAALAYKYRQYAQTYCPLIWNWDSPEYADYRNPQVFNNPKIPKNEKMLLGTGTSGHQVDGNRTDGLLGNCANSTWTEWEKLNLGKKDKEGEFIVEQASGLACDHWNRYKEDIKLMKEQLGVNCYRFSVEWSKIEPEKGKFSEEALKHYEDICQELVKNGIQPCITLHHYTDPLWFVDKEGNYGFENAENIQYYVRFATTVIKRLHRFNPLWFTFNSPDGYAAQGYQTCTKPAGRLTPKKDMQLLSEVYKNLLEAHVQVYRTIKADPTYASARIGILKNMFPLDPYNIYNPLDLLGCSMGSYIIDTPFFEFFTTGNFKTKIPTKVNINYRNPKAIGALDFVGINYYSHGYMKNFNVIRHEDEKPTNNKRYSLYAEGLYRVIKEMSEKLAKPLNVPIYITENGISSDETTTTPVDVTLQENGKEKATRQEFLQKYLFALSKAIQDGYDVRGYMYWSFMDNYEWGRYSKNYGLFEVDFKGGSLQRTFRPSAQFYVDTIKKNLGPSAQDLKREKEYAL